MSGNFCTYSEDICPGVRAWTREALCYVSNIRYLRSSVYCGCLCIRDYQKLCGLCSVFQGIDLTCVVQQTLATVVYYPIFYAKSLLFPPFGYLAGPHYRLLLPAWTLTAKVDSDCQPVSFV